MVVCSNVMGGTIFLMYFCTAPISSLFSGGNRSPMLTITTVLIEVFGSTSATLVANKSIATSPTAPLSVN